MKTEKVIVAHVKPEAGLKRLIRSMAISSSYIAISLTDGKRPGLVVATSRGEHSTAYVQKFDIIRGIASCRDDIFIVVEPSKIHLLKFETITKMVQSKKDPSKGEPKTTIRYDTLATVSLRTVGCKNPVRSVSAFAKKNGQFVAITVGDKGEIAKFLITLPQGLVSQGLLIYSSIHSLCPQEAASIVLDMNDTQKSHGHLVPTPPGRHDANYTCVKISPLGKSFAVGTKDRSPLISSVALYTLTDEWIVLIGM